MVGKGYANGLLEALLIVAWPVVTLFAAGTAFVILLLFHFLKKEQYWRPPRPEKGVEFVAARGAVNAQISALAPTMMLLAEKENSVVARLERGALSEEARQMTEKLLQDAFSDGFWKKFVEASALAESDPVKAHEELRCLSSMAETVLEKLSRVEETVRGDTGAPSREDGSSERAE